VELTLSLLGGKWKTVILSHLKQSPLRYAELRNAIPGLSDKMLTQRLRDLEKSGLVERSTPSKGQARYRLTAYGRSFAPALEALYACGIHAAPEVGARFRDEPVERSIHDR
jgi:DNA-binding HxlR family transcriptional regulator